MTVLVAVEDTAGDLAPASREAVTFARSVTAEPCDVVAMGTPTSTLTNSLGAYGVRRVYAHTAFDDVPFAPAAVASAIAASIEQTQPELVIAGASSRYSEIFAHLAAQLDAPLATNVIAAHPTADGLQLTRTRWGGVLFEDAMLTGAPALVTIAPHHIDAVPTPNPTDVIVDEQSTTPAATHMIGAVAAIDTAEDGVGLANAPVVIAGGRGVGSGEGFAVLEELAQLLGGAVGCSRVATNNGWRSHNDQVGQTGTRIAPDLYVACGISGATQHWVGCMAAKRILAINTDVEAPMVTRAHYAAIGDLHEILPAVVAEVRARTGR